jgi:hypothetical protein
VIGHSGMITHDSVRGSQQLDKSNLPMRAQFLAAGSIWQVSCSSPEILQVMGEAFQPLDRGNAQVDLDISFRVDPTLSETPPWPQPYFRGLDHMVYAAYGTGSSMLVDLQARRIIGLFSEAMAQDSSYWRRVLLPFLLGIVGHAISVTPLHCACLVRDGHGLVLGGASGAGKSTLALCLSLNGFAYLSDDCTYFSRSDSHLHAWGLPVPMKLLPDVVRYFPQLSASRAVPSLNGEMAIHLDPETIGATRASSCEPRWLVFIERTAEPVIGFRQITSREAASRFVSDLETLPPCISDQRRHQLATLDALVDRECWILRHGVTPAVVARRLQEFCETRG